MERTYYVMTSVYQNITIFTPADNPKVFIRPILTREEAEQLIDRLPQLECEAYQGHAMRDLVEHYESVMKTHSCTDLAALTKSIYNKKILAESQNKKLGAIDERFLQKAEDLLFGELAVVLAIPKDKVIEYITERNKEK